MLTSLRAVDTQGRRLISAISETPTPRSIPEKYRDLSYVISEKDASRLPEHRAKDHAIDLEPGEQLPQGPIYTLLEKELEVLREYLDLSEKKGWIRRSISLAGASIIFVLKKGGLLRLYINYRELNRITIKNRTLLPLISETLDRLGKAKVFTKLNLKDAYHRIRIKKGDEQKTAFRIRYRYYKYCVMPFSLTNALATF